LTVKLGSSETLDRCIGFSLVKIGSFHLLRHKADSSKQGCGSRTQISKSCWLRLHISDW